MTIARKAVDIELRFYGSFAAVEASPGHFRGGPVEPDLGAVWFNCWREVADEDGMRPAPGGATGDGRFQVNLAATKEGLRELGRYFPAMAELDAAADPDYHEHHAAVSDDGRTQFHLTMRKASEA